jgi:hypothetical protein
LDQESSSDKAKQYAIDELLDLRGKAVPLLIGPLSKTDRESSLAVPSNDRTNVPPIRVSDLQQNPVLLYKIHVFVYNLRKLDTKKHKKSRARLELLSDASYIAMPYFTDQEATMLKTLIVNTDNKSLEEGIQQALQLRLKERAKKSKETGDCRVCAAHDLAPVFERVFQINPKELASSPEFLAVLESAGLELEDGQNWEGLFNKSPQGYIDKKKKRRRNRKSGNGSGQTGADAENSTEGDTLTTEFEKQDLVTQQAP